VSKIPKPIILSGLSLVVAIAGGWMYSGSPQEEPESSLSEMTEDRSTETREPDSGGFSDQTVVNVLVVHPDNNRFITQYANVPCQRADSVSWKKDRISEFKGTMGSPRTTCRLIVSDPFVPTEPEEFFEVWVTEADQTTKFTVNVNGSEKPLVVSNRMIFRDPDNLDTGIYVCLVGSMADSGINDGNQSDMLEHLDEFLLHPVEK